MLKDFGTAYALLLAVIQLASTVHLKPKEVKCRRLHLAKVSVAHYLKRLHNLALGLGWISIPVLVPKLWPTIQHRKVGLHPIARNRRSI
jgi:hypothetical protein